jgi:hypothetical protein
MAGSSLGFLITSGLLGRRLSLRGAAACELLGRGDILRPWEDGLAHLAPPRVDWRVLHRASIAVLDEHTTAAIRRWPGLDAAIVARALRRSRCLAYLMTVSRFTRAEDRLLGALWHLASRWGQTTPRGVVVPFKLSHEILGEVVGTGRPAVTAALGRLEDAELVTRRPDRRWELHGDPPYAH